MPATKNFSKVIVSVARVSFREIVRDKVLYNILLASAALLSAGLLAAKLSYIRPERVVLDFGLSAVNLSCAMIAIFYGASTLSREFERRTIWLALSKPITRTQFILGKFVGLAAVIFLNWALLAVSYVIILAIAAPEAGMGMSATLFFALAALLVQSWILASVALAFSTFTTTSLAVVFAIGTYLIGSIVPQLRALSAQIQSGVGGSALALVASLVPNLENLNWGAKVTYALPVSPGFVFQSLIYGCVWIALPLVAAGFLVRWKDN